MRAEKLSKILGSPGYAEGMRCSVRVLSILLLLFLGAALLLEGVRLPQSEEAGLEEFAAAGLMRDAVNELKAMRGELGVKIDPVLDPNMTGMIGWDYSDITTTVGSLPAKRTSCNPAFAALLTRLLKEAGCREGDLVVLSLTGSFPALNVAALSACKALGLEARFVSSVGSSTYGANIPGFSWLDMEKRLYERGIFPYYATAVSYGGVVETGGGIDGTGLDLAQQAVLRHGARLLAEGDYQDVERATLERKGILDAKGRPSCYVNVGGGLTALGWVAESSRLDNGLLREVPVTDDPARGLVFRYAEEGVPVIHMLNIERLANRYALPVDPVPLPDPASALRTGAFYARYFLLSGVLAIWAISTLILLRKEGGAGAAKKATLRSWTTEGVSAGCVRKFLRSVFLDE